jgi:hypothetical protein
MIVIYLGFYVSNLLLSRMMAPKKRMNDRKELYKVLRICPGDAEHTFLIAGQDAGPFVHKLLEIEASSKVLAHAAMVT